jgi:rhodanese-related sulfurtransferase
MVERGLASTDEARYQQCLSAAKHCQAKFDVATLSSEDLIRMMFDDLVQYNDLLIVDVRTVPERRVSQIPGSITVAECHEKLRRNNCQTVVTYCTIGYRSGLEAANLREKYPESTVYNLDGILAYAHGVLNWIGTNDDRNENVHHMLCPMDKVHCFGAQWARLAPAEVSTSQFLGLELAGRLFQVGWLKLSRCAQHLTRAAVRCLPRR